MKKRISLNTLMMTGGMAGLAAFSTGCGSSKGTSSSGATSIATLPAASSAVSSSSAGFVEAANRSPATTGLVLANMSTTLSSMSGKSSAFCEASSIIRDALRAVASPDKTKCYVGAVEAKGQFGSTNLYDGADHYLSLKVSGSELMRFRLKATKGSDGTVSSFAAYSCQVRGTSALTQTEYLNISLSGTTASVTSVELWNDGTNNSSERATATGSYANGAWTSKSITLANTGSYTGGGQTNQSSLSVNLTQKAGSMVLSGFRSGSYGGNSYSTAAAGEIQLLNPSKLTTIALGEGTINFTESFTGQGGHSGTNSWNGDTFAVAASSSYQAGTPPSVTTVSAAFGTGETWNCMGADGTAASLTSVDLTSMWANGINAAPTDATAAACDTVYGFSDQNWVSCYNGS